MTDDVNPLAELDAGRVPALSELKLHNGTVWRWNRPVYDIAHGLPHIRLENRGAGGPTAVDMVANALFFYGLLRVLVEAERPLWSYMSSTPRTRTSRARRATAWTPPCTGRAPAGSTRTSWCCASCRRWPPKGWLAGEWHPRCATGTC